MRSSIGIKLILVVLFGMGCSGGDNVEEWKAEGKQAFLSQDYTKTRECLQKVLVKQPSDRESLRFIGISYQRDFMYDSALFYLKRIDILYPNDRSINQQIHALATALGEEEDAIRAIYTLAKTGDGYEKYYGQLLVLSEDAGNYRNALHWGRKAIGSQPDTLRWYFHTSNMASKLDSFDVAIEILDSASSRFGDNNQILARKANLLGAKGDYPEAELLVRDILARDTTTDYRSRLSLALILSHQDEIEKKQEALGLYREIEKSAPYELRIDTVIANLEKDLGE